MIRHTLFDLFSHSMAVTLTLAIAIIYGDAPVEFLLIGSTLATVVFGILFLFVWFYRRKR